MNNKFESTKHMRLYYVWTEMKQRCYNQNSKNYKNYGKRGIVVELIWLESFENFYKWAIENGYDEHAPRGVYTLDRINTDGNYGPNNCRWLSISKQQLNKRTNHLLTINGRTQTISQWAAEYGLKRGTIPTRLKLGWRGNDLIKPAVPPKIRKPITINGETKTLRQWSKDSGISYAVLLNRVNKNWNEKDLLLPVNYTKNILYITINGETRSVREWAKLTGLHVETIRKRFKKGLQGYDLIKPAIKK